MSSLKFWCALNRAPQLGNKGFSQLLAAFGSPDAFFAADTQTIRAALPNVAEKTWRQWLAMAEDEAVQADLDWLAAADNRHILTWQDSAYPPLLKQIPDPPPLLFVLGEAELLSMVQLGVVGSRQSTQGGEDTCRQICAQVSAAGIVITSGMALGIDGTAHQAALAAGGKTIAVVGTGLDRVYPARHRDLAHQIATQGAIVSEFPIGVGVRQHHFPQRNRIISGLSAGVLVVEAGLQSGSLITARHAAEQGREVFAIPNSIHNPLSRGCHALIKQGAKLTESAEDILEELLPLAQAAWQLAERQPQAVAISPTDTEQNAAVHGENATLAQSLKVNADNPAEAQLLAAMGYDPVRVEQLLERTDLTISEISAMLLMLELDGRVQALPGGRYQRLKS